MSFRISQGQGKPRRRASCDPCATSKVKCDGSEGACERCVQRGISCHYSISKRIGRPKRGSIRCNTVTIGSQAGIDEAKQPENDSALEASSADELQVKNKERFSAPDPGINHSGFPSDTVLESTDWSRSYEMPHNSHIPLWPAEPAQSIEAREYIPMPSSIHESSSWLDPLTSFQCRMPADSDEVLSSATISPLTEFTTPCTPAADLETRSVREEVCQILADLEIRSGPKSVHGLETGQEVQMDRILSLNRVAIMRLNCLILHQSSPRPDIAVLFCSVFCRLLLLYQGAVQSTSRSLQQQDTAALSCLIQEGSIQDPETPSWKPSSLQDYQDWIVSPLDPVPVPRRSSAQAKIAIGSFDIDDAGLERAFQKQVLQNEAIKLGHSIDSFVYSYMPSDATSHGSTDLDSAAALYQSLCVWLRQEHSRLLRAIDACPP